MQPRPNHAADFSLLITQKPERRLLTGRGAWDEGREQNGRARLLPSRKRQRIAIGDWRLVNDFSGGQCSRTAEKFGLEKSVKSHVPCPVSLVPHWLKPVA